MSDPRPEPPRVTISRPGEPPREAELLAPPEPRRPLPRSAKGIAALALLQIFVGLNAVSVERDRVRERAEAERLDVRVTAGGEDRTYGAGGILALTFAAENRGGGAARFGVPTLDPPLFPVIASAPPNPVERGAVRVFALRLRPTCPGFRVPQDPPALRMLLPVLAPSGREEVVPVPLDTALVLELATSACGLVTPARAARAAVFEPIRTTRSGVEFGLRIENRSRRGFELVRLVAPGLRLATDVPLPVAVLPGLSAEIRVTMSVESCALVAKLGTAQQAGARDLEPAEFDLFLLGVDGTREPLRYRNRPGEPLNTAWLSYIARMCGNR